MEKFKLLQKIKDIYAKGENIIQYLKNEGEGKGEENSIEDILISYDFQSGSYTKGFSNNPEFKYKYCSALAKIIDKVEKVESIMEVGVGEATTLTALIKRLKTIPPNILGFDISWSRLKFAQELLKEFNINNVNLFTANLFEIPLLDSSVDVVYTSHSLEPNGGKEEAALKELYRVCKRYLILLEPSYELANTEARERMKSHGYITDLYNTAKKLEYNIIEHRLFEYSSNPLNPTGIIIIEKKAGISNELGLVCPVSHTKVEKYNESLLFSEESLLAYPIIDGIACLLQENSILATQLLTDYQEFKKANNVVFKK